MKLLLILSPYLSFGLLAGPGLLPLSLSAQASRVAEQAAEKAPSQKTLRKLETQVAMEVGS